MKAVKKTNKALLGIFKLNHNIKLYIPSTINADTAINSEKYINDTLSLFSGLFGGATSYEAKGAWLSNVKGLIVEKIVIVESYATSQQIDLNIEKVLQHALKIKKELNQEAVSLEYDNELYLV